jgi:hypothetical protein
MRAIRAQRGAKLRFIFDRSRVMKARHLKAESLATTTCTQFEHG